MTEDKKSKHKISVYIDTGDVYSYGTDSSAREHVSAIVKTGYRSVDSNGTLTHWPPHRITKVVATNCNTMYPDTVRGT